MYEWSQSSIFWEKFPLFSIRMKKPYVHYSVTLKVQSQQHLKQPSCTAKSFFDGLAAISGFADF